MSGDTWGSLPLPQAVELTRRALLNCGFANWAEDSDDAMRELLRLAHKARTEGPGNLAATLYPGPTGGDDPWAEAERFADELHRLLEAAAKGVDP